MEWEIYKGLNLGKKVNTPLFKHQRHKAKGLKAFLNKGLNNNLKDNKVEDKYKAQIRKYLKQNRKVNNAIKY